MNKETMLAVKQQIAEFTATLGGSWKTKVGTFLDGTYWLCAETQIDGIKVEINAQAAVLDDAAKHTRVGFSIVVDDDDSMGEFHLTLQEAFEHARSCIEDDAIKIADRMAALSRLRRHAQM